MIQEIKHFIDGQSYAGSGSRRKEIFNPANGQMTAYLKYAEAADVDAAVAAAKSAFPAWQATSPLARSRVLFRFKALLEENIDHLAELISMQHGKVHADALGEITRGIEVVEFACGAPQLLKGEWSEGIGRGIDSYSTRRPLGVVAGVTPFNFPAMVPMWMFPIALACGNCFILKPSEQTPSASLLMAELLTQAGLPDGVFNVIHGDRFAVEELLRHADVKAVSFVGSTPVARLIYRVGAEQGKRVQALGGAKNHLLVMPDADMDKVVDALMGAAYGSAGERCMAISVAVPVTDKVADQLVAKLRERLSTLSIGVGREGNPDMGPLVSAQHRDKVCSYIDAGVAEGADLVVDGRQFVMRQAGYEKGYFLGASLFDHVTTDMRIYREEIFGPVLAVVRAADYEAAVAMINAHEFGNGASIFTASGEYARAFSHDVESGMVGVNVPIPVPMAFHSFGGWKNSLFGDHHIHGPEGVRFYTRLKTVTTRWRHSARAEFSMPTIK